MQKIDLKIKDNLKKHFFPSSLTLRQFNELDQDSRKSKAVVYLLIASTFPSKYNPISCKLHHLILVNYFFITT
jgi:hypothetical protein